MRYQEPSIIEALCEFTFQPGAAWDATVFGRFYERIETEFPDREQGEVIEGLVEQKPDRVEQQVRRVSRMRFFNADRTRLIQLSENLLVVNVLRPYTHWDEFKRLIFDAAQRYGEVVPSAQVGRTVLRYIDQFEFDASTFRLGDWIECQGRYFPPGLADHALPVLYHMRLELSSSEQIAMGLGVRDEQQGQRRTVILDTEVTDLDVRQADRSAEAALDRMHTRIIDVFEGCITNKTREMLQPLRD